MVIRAREKPKVCACSLISSRTSAHPPGREATRSSLMVPPSYSGWRRALRRRLRVDADGGDGCDGGDDCDGEEEEKDFILLLL